MRGLTFVTPHQRRNSGGAYTIERFAQECARWTPVTLVVEKGATRAVDGVRVRSWRSDDEDLPDADSTIVPADSHLVERLLEQPQGKGSCVLLLQGFGTPGNPTVSRNLAQARRVLAGARWLIGVAERSGCAARLIRYGLDRSVFHPDGRSQADQVVGLMASALPWKGTDDGVRALQEVREAVPDVEFRLFGNHDPGLEGAAFLAAPPAGRQEIADLMRECTVFVCSSWEEGFGLPGVEAMSCGAALATTDTKGSRDYAFHGETALVSAPGDPAALAAHVIELLKDPQLRARLVRQGEAHLRASFPPWSRTGESFMASLSALLRTPVPTTR